MVMPRRKVDICGLIYRPRDPEKYGYICPSCCVRHGAPQASGIIDVVRCPRCPSLAAVEAAFNAKKRVERIASKQKRAGG